MPISLSIQVFRAGSAPSLQTRTVTPTTSTTTYAPSSGYDGFSNFTVNGDSNFISSNIRKDITIWRITGTLKPMDSHMSWGDGGTFRGDGSYSHFFPITAFNPSINMLTWGIAIFNGQLADTYKDMALLSYHYFSSVEGASYTIYFNGNVTTRSAQTPTISSTGVTVGTNFLFYSGITYSYIIYALYYTG